MRITVAAASAALLALAVCGCAPAGADPAEAAPGPSDVQHEGSYVPPTSGPGARAPDGPRWAGAAAPPLVVIGEAGYTALLQSEEQEPTTDMAVGVLRLVDGCLEVTLDHDPSRYGAVLLGGVGIGPDRLVIDGAVLPFGERLELPWATTAPMDRVPEGYGAACPGVSRLFGIGS